MSTRRGKKINPAKNAGSARDFAAGKKIGRPKQRWVWDVVKTIAMPHTPLALGDKITSGTVIAQGVNQGQVDSKWRIAPAAMYIEIGQAGHWEKMNGAN